jgi:SagB-type dehydrogenase family enzyme
MHECKSGERSDMKTKVPFFMCLAVTVLCICLVSASSAQDLKTIPLPKPDTDGGRPMMEVLKDRKSSRTFSTARLPMQVLSDMLWAAFGVNRRDSGKRTAPSAVNWQEIDIYVATVDALYLYDARTHVLKLVVPEDIRAATGRQPFVQEAPVNLIFVADFSRMTRAGYDEKVFYSAVDTGYISQNVYLYCASEGLATVVLGLIDRQLLAKVMRLRPDQKVILTQPVGYPKKQAFLPPP